MERKTPWKIYLSRALSGWGDRLWAFGAGIFMNLLAPQNLRLVAIYGFATSVSVIIFGAMIGSWIDKTTRLKAAKTFLAIQNLVASLCCALLAAFFWFDDTSSWPALLLDALPVVAILLAVIANLASVGYQIAVEKDWIVVISDNDNDVLAKMNSVFRTIDLLCLLIAPSLAGLIFDFMGNAWAAIFIALWNILSVGIEYYLLYAIYKDFPALGHKKMDSEPYMQPSIGKESHTSSSILKLPKTVWTSIVDSLKAWLLYMQHPARDAGLGLAFLYMTVLGFDNITWGYCLSQCVTESILGGLVGISAIFGVLGSLTFPVLRKKVGLNSTGVVGTITQLMALATCVVSIWLAGSPFDMYYFSNGGNSNLTTAMPTTTTTTTVVFRNKTGSVQPFVESLQDTDNFTTDVATEVTTMFDFTTEWFEQIVNVTAGPDEETESECTVSSYASVAAFLAGIIGARFGLWLIDLSITQILQERVEEEHRGIMNGVQNGLNNGMNTVKFILVIILPENGTFGWLIIASFSFVCLGAISYNKYACKNKDSSKINVYIDNSESQQGNVTSI